MRTFPREIVRGRAYLREVESNLPRLLAKPALIVWPDSDPGFGDAELARWRSLFPAAPTVILRRTGQVIDEDAPEDVAAAIPGGWPQAGSGQALGVGRRRSWRTYSPAITSVRIARAPP